MKATIDLRAEAEGNADPSRLLLEWALAAIAVGVWAFVASRRTSDRIALHEAGHAVVARRLIPELGIAEASIVERPSLLRRGGHVNFLPYSFDVSPRRIPASAELGEDGVLRVGLEHAPTPTRWAMLAMSLAGIAAEMDRDVLDRRELERPNGGGYAHDLGMARRLAASLDGKRPPWSGRVPGGIDVDFSGEAHEGPMVFAYAKTRRIVSSDANAIDRLSDSLVSEGKMAGRDVVATIEGF